MADIKLVTGALWIDKNGDLEREQELRAKIGVRA